MTVRTIGICAAIALTSIGACSTTAPDTRPGAALADHAREDANKSAAVEFYQALIGDSDYDKAETHVGAYVQHDPNVDGDGFAPLKHYLMTDPSLTQHVFRFDTNGKIAEHWMSFEQVNLADVRNPHPLW